MKKILVIDNTFDPPHGCPEIQDLLRKAASSLGEIEIEAVRAPDSKIPSDLSKYDGAVLSGSKTRISETEPWIEAEMSAIRQLFERKIPTLGICYGEQLIARTMGGDTGQAKNAEFGWVELEVSAESPIFAGMPKKFFSFEYHRDEVRKLPPGFNLTASSGECAVQAYDVQGSPMWGLQFHPERGVEHGERSIARVAAEGEKVFNARKGHELFQASVGETIFKNFLKIVWARK